MPLEVQPLTDADASRFVAIADAALGSTGVGLCLGPHPQPEIEKTLASKPYVHYLKVVDSDTGDVLACAKWEIHDQGRSDEQLAELDEPIQVAEEQRQYEKAHQEFFGYLNAGRKALGKKPHYFLSLLITDPNHQGRGAGGMLLRWGLERADKAGLITYLEATEAGRPVYKRFGFEDIKTTEFDLSRWGGQGIELNTTMVRQP
ncbi:uncharacterized protein K452DRAFT_257132, partial [Aplosporella prunicola CBS 121167]